MIKLKVRHYKTRDGRIGSEVTNRKIVRHQLRLQVSNKHLGDVYRSTYKTIFVKPKKRTNYEKKQTMLSLVQELFKNKRA